MGGASLSLRAAVSHVAVSPGVLALLLFYDGAEAASFNIPWQQILREEIRAERTLREYLADVESEWKLWSAFWILPRSLLCSWRVRKRIHDLSWEAATTHSRESLRELRKIHSHLAGGSNGQNGRKGSGALIAKHLWFGHQRILLLQRISRAAAKSRGDLAERIAFVLEKTHCRLADAEWGVQRECGAPRNHRLDDAMRRAREEGFELPSAESELRAFRLLRRLVRSGKERLRTSSRRRSEPS